MLTNKDMTEVTFDSINTTASLDTICTVKKKEKKKKQKQRQKQKKN